MSFSKGNCLVEEIGHTRDPYLSMELLEVHNETEEIVILEYLRCVFGTSDSTSYYFIITQG